MKAVKVLAVVVVLYLTLPVTTGPMRKSDLERKNECCIPLRFEVLETILTVV